MEEILRVFLLAMRNPTTLNRQGGDIGTQYRSVIFITARAQHLKVVQRKCCKS
ncbi:MAG: peptide-methionine (S)-S-oxide reductase [Sphingobacteriales bacterium]|nr:peptide-methionine (S)-S-oxide reductase [Sphingobacteriales bacterium]